jgi:arylsulfatase A-like enzyme
MIHKFLRCVAAIDDNVKRVLEYLDAEGIKDNTLIIYTSDQGYWLGQHNMHDKRLILEESLKMPFIVRYPKEVKAGTVNDRLGMNIDFGPTMLDYAGVKIPAAMQGVSLRPLLRGENPGDWRTGIFYAYYARAPMHWGIRTQRYKLIHFPDTDAIEFYDLKNDPNEMHNAASDPDQRTTIAATEEQLNKLMNQTGITKKYLLEHMKNNKERPPLSGVRRVPRKKNK